MVFKPGESGNPTGGRGKKLFLDALNSLISQPSIGLVPELPENSTVAHVMAQRLITEAVGNAKDPKTALAFIQEICDRAYGKPKQTLIGGDEDDRPLIPEKIQIELIAPRIVPMLTDETSDT